MGLSQAAILNWVNHVDCIPTITARFKLLNSNSWQPYTINDPDTGLPMVGPLNDQGDISKFVSAASIACDTSQKVHRSLDITFKEDNSFVFNALIDSIQVFLDYWDGNPSEGGTFLFEVPLGRFLFTLPEVTIQDSGQLGHAIMGDFSVRALNLEFMNTYTVPAGTGYIQAARALMSQNSIPLSIGGTGFTPTGYMDCPGPGVPLSTILVDSLTAIASTAVTPSPIAFTRDQNFYDAAASMLAAISYYPPWFDGMGNCRFTPRPNLKQAVPAPTWKYHTDASSIIFPGVQFKAVNWDKLANAITYYCENSNTPSFSATVLNDHSGSALGITTIGYTIFKSFKDNKIPDQASCALRAYVKLTEAAALAEQVDFKTKPSPFATDAHEYLDLAITDINNNAVISNPTGYEETAWKLDLSTLEQTHTCGKMVVI